MDGFDITSRFVQGLAEPAVKFAGFPPYNFIGGHNDPGLIPIEGLIDATSAVLRREGQKLAMYNLSQGPQGFIGLREFVAAKSRERRGMSPSPDDVLITTGSGQGIDVVSRLLLNPGDTVLLEEFCYAGAINRFRKLGARLVALPLDEQGIRTDKLAAILADLKKQRITPKLLYTIPTIQNPTGSILPLDRRQELLKLTREYGVPVFEDECYADLLWHSVDAPPSLYALAPEQVIHIGSFSKSLAPALRVGYAIAQWPVLRHLIANKGDSGTGALDQLIVAEYFGHHFARHIDELSTGLREKLDTMQEAIESEFGTSIETWRPQGGIFLWMKLPGEVDVRTLLKPAADAGIAFNPGPEWAVDGEAARSHLRLCFALPSKETIRKGVAAFARVCYEQTGIPQQSSNIRHGDRR